MSQKRYYWLKLKEDFFDDKQIKYLRSLPDGDKLVITYLKMQLKSLKTDGIIRYDKILPSSEEELSLLLDEDVNIVKLTLKALEQINAIEILEDNSIYMMAMQELIGSEGSSALRMRNMRAKQKSISSHCAESVAHCYGEIEIDIEKDIDIEIEKDIEKDKDKDNISSEKKSKHKYGEYKNVLLTNEELERLQNEYSNANELIKYLDEYIEMKGYKAKSHYLAIKKWVVDAAAEEQKRKNKKTTTNNNPFFEILKEEGGI